MSLLMCLMELMAPRLMAPRLALHTVLAKTTLKIFARSPAILLNVRRTVFPRKVGLMSILRKAVTRASTDATLGLMLAQPIVILPDAILLPSRRVRKLTAILKVVASLHLILETL